MDRGELTQKRTQGKRTGVGEGLSAASTQVCAKVLGLERSEARVAGAQGAGAGMQTRWGQSEGMDTLLYAWSIHTGCLVTFKHVWSFLPLKMP